MANKDSTRHKNKKKHKKEKAEKHKKHKKHKRKRHTNSDSSDSEEFQEKEVQKPQKREEWDFFDTIISSSNATIKGGKEKTTKRPTPEKLGQNIKELNPYWKNGGCGLPPTHVNENVKNKILDNRLSDQGSSSKDSNKFMNTERLKLGFLKPGEDSNINAKANTFQRNWKKKDVSESESKSKRQEHVKENKHKETISSSKPLTNEELNKLAAKLMKAEILGNTSLVNKLKAELEAAKKVKETSDDQTKGENKKIIVVDRSMKKPYEGNQSSTGSKRQKISTHDSQGRVCYFPDDDKYSLKNLFEREKAGLEEQISIPASKLASKNSEDLDDSYLEAAASIKMQKKLDEKQHQIAIQKATAKHRAFEGCKFCLDNRNKTKHLIISTGKNCYLCVPEEESLALNHCLIVPLQHELSTLHLDEDVWSEIKTYQRVLTKMFLEQDQDVIFFENARSFKYYPHCFIQCVPLDKEVGDLAPVYFQKAISESETEWSMNKKVVDFRNKDLRRSIPKGLPYFAVSFGTEGGFAHVIEDEQLFKRNFAEEVIGGMLDLDHKKWRKPQAENFRNQRQKALEFLKLWRKHEFNENSSCTDCSSSE